MSTVRDQLPTNEAMTNVEKEKVLQDYSEIAVTTLHVAMKYIGAKNVRGRYTTADGTMYDLTLTKVDCKPISFQEYQERTIKDISSSHGVPHEFL